MARSYRVNVKLTEKAREQLVAISKSNRRSLSSMAEILLEDSMARELFADDTRTSR